MSHLICINDLAFSTSDLGDFTIAFMEALYDYDTDHYDGLVVIINKNQSSDHDAVYLHQMVTLWGDQRPIFKDGETWVSLQWLEQAIEAQHEEVLKAILESWGPYQWEETDEPSHCLLRGRVGYYDAPRYKNLYRKDAMTRV